MKNELPAITLSAVGNFQGAPFVNITAHAEGVHSRLVGTLLLQGDQWVLDEEDLARRPYSQEALREYGRELFEKAVRLANEKLKGFVAGVEVRDLFGHRIGVPLEEQRAKIAEALKPYTERHPDKKIPYQRANEYLKSLEADLGSILRAQNLVELQSVVVIHNLNNFKLKYQPTVEEFNDLLEDYRKWQCLYQDSWEGTDEEKGAVLRKLEEVLEGARRKYKELIARDSDEKQDLPSETEGVLSPGIGVNLWQLEVLSGDPSKSLAVRFKHGDLDMEAAGSRLENVPSDTDIGRVRDACAEIGLKLVITSQTQWNIYARIIPANLSDADLDKAKDCNILTEPESDLEICDPNDVPNFQVRSFGVACVDVSSSEYFKTYEDAEKYVRQQFEKGYRGWVMIQANLPYREGVRSPFVADIKVTDDGLEIQRNDRELQQARTQ